MEVVLNKYFNDILRRSLNYNEEFNIIVENNTIILKSNEYSRLISIDKN